jgi:UDP-N-acetylenolpyruvoylglucosamine reductase
VPLKKYTTIKIGGLTKYIVFPKNNDELIFILELIRQENYNYFVLGNGSNVLFEEGEFEGIIISTKKLNVDFQQYTNFSKWFLFTVITVLLYFFVENFL